MTKATKKQLARRRELALDVYDAECENDEDGDPDMGNVFENIEEALREEGLPLFTSDAEANQAIKDERKLKLRNLDIVIKHLKATGRPDAVVGDVMEAAMAEIEKLDEAEEVRQ